MKLATSEAHLVQLWKKSKLLSWRVARALSDGQLLQLHTWAVKTERSWRNKETNYVTTKYQITWFEVLRRNLVTEAMFVEYLALMEILGRDKLRDWIWIARSGEVGGHQLTLTDEVEALRDLHAHAAPFATRLRAFVVNNVDKLSPVDVRHGEVLLLLAIAWGPELAQALAKLYAGAPDEVKVSHLQSHATAALSDALTGSPHVDAMVAVIKKAIKGKRLNDVVEQAVARLANRRSLIPPASAGAPAEEIQWSRTPTEDAVGLLMRFKGPVAAIEQGLRSTDPVAVLNAWAAAASMCYKHEIRAARRSRSPRRRTCRHSRHWSVTTLPNSPTARRSRS